MSLRTIMIFGKYLMLICKYQWRYLFVYKEEEDSDYISTRNRNLERGLT